MTLRDALAEAATPGPWASEEAVGEYPDALVYGPDGDAFAMLTWNPGNDYDPVATAAYIAAANPTVVLALLDVVDAAIEAREVVVYHNFGIPTGWVLAGEKEMDALRAALARYEEVSRDPA